ncbi:MULTISPECIES: ABC transporter permease [unclassified Rathayibacter]|uniref:ABC transporter permease n=1 Tax=unclassified Rathayibacter TaxID=2609250 RepID=UPI001FB36EC6|nr:MULTISPECIES: ABC transporter permease [unclassified Rathayibacter]MCJ1673902.1 ABC transporter permease [Rathayibacter sp. VKM Ac-2929]MCJ1683102.1 ABC transporter permease [Rathayibacter sp. VKM Ac-2928]MCJ1687979.1 ABC transporter permease [Rathayibacter sp. VKM Ac-2927]
MRFLVRKLRRDLLRYSSQFVSVLLMSALSVTVYAGLEGAWRGMQVEIDSFAAENALPDAWVSALGSTDEDVAAFAALPGVTAVARTTTFALAHPLAEGTGTLLTTTTTTTTGSDAVDVPLVLEGAALSADGGGVWIDEGYARLNGIAVGDQVPLSRAGVASTLEVRGLVLVPDALALTEPGMIAPEPGRYAAAVIAPETAAALGVPLVGDTLRVLGDADTVREAAPGILGERYLGVADRSTNAAIAPVYDRIEQIRGLAVLFSALFVLVALLAVFTSIRRLVDIQRTEIATLGALGMGRRAIGLYYAGLSSVVVGTGVLLGGALAPVLSLYVLDTQRGSFALPEWRIAYTWTSPALAAGLVLACGAGAWAVTARARRLTPAEGMRPPAEHSHRMAIERLPALWSRIGFGERWALRDAAGNPVRVAVGVVAAAGCMMLLVAGFGIPESLARQIERGYGDQYRYAASVQVAPGATPEQLAELAAQAGPGQWIQQRPFRLTGAGAGPAEYVLTVLGPGDLYLLRDASGTPLSLVDGPVVTSRIQEATGGGVGSRVDLEVGGAGPVAAMVAAVADVSQPQGLLLSEAAWTGLGEDFAPTAYLTQAPLDGAPASAAAGPVLALSEQRANAESVVAALSGVFTLMKVLAILLVVVSLYNLGALGFSERERSYATLRVLGTRDGELRTLALTENAITAVLGWLAGIPAGLWFLGRYTDIFSDDRAVYAPYVSLPSVLAASAITLGFASTATLLLTRRVRRIEMASALKGVE